MSSAIVISGTGREDGQKDRPFTIVAAIRADAAGDIRVLVLPVTHSPPDHSSLALEIPATVKRRLGLDAARSWIVFWEWNEFVWRGPDLRRIGNADDASVSYGMLPLPCSPRCGIAFWRLRKKAGRGR